MDSKSKYSISFSPRHFYQGIFRVEYTVWSWFPNVFGFLNAFWPSHSCCWPGNKSENNDPTNRQILYKVVYRLVLNPWVKWVITRGGPPSPDEAPPPGGRLPPGWERSFWEGLSEPTHAFSIRKSLYTVAQTPKFFLGAAAPRPPLLCFGWVWL